MTTDPRRADLLARASGDTDTLRDELLDEVATLKAEIVERFNRLTVLALLFSEAEDKGGMASQFGRCTSKQWVTTMAAICDTFGPETMLPDDPLDMAWWLPLTKADNPGELLKASRDGEWNAAQNRKAAGVVQERKPPLYTGGGTMGANGNTVHLDSQVSRSGRVDVRLKPKE